MVLGTGATRKTVPDIVVLDTCVLISNVLRRLLLRLADQDCFRPAWSEIIGDEWRRNAARIWETEPETIAGEWNGLQELYPDADQGDIALFKQGLVHSDPKDWHVIAAARAALAKHPLASVAVVTRNLRDFRRAELRRLNIGLMDPDQLLVHCWQSHRERLLSALEAVPSDFASTGRPLEALDVILKRERLFRFNRLYALGV